MQAIRHHAFGPPDVLALEDLPDLAPGPGEVRIAVESAGVHLLDTTLRRGEPAWTADLGGVDVVYDGVGGAVGRAALELLRPGGRQVMFGCSSGEPTRFDSDDVVSRALTVGWSLGPRMAALPGGIPGLAARSLARAGAGEWEPLVTTYPLAEAARAHAELEGRRTLGKLVLVT